ncbi:hypothetical protein BC8716_07345 [Shouchella clausii]|nr:hypothetical protein BC8716_07345 [Shouchella clausii]KKI86681.1 hypothetical protein WZ76_09640 [Shouchella clausii]PAD47266.1 hypothetical protein CHI09_08175 [Shouchella clausii]QNM42123.1 hypothetical protein DUT88_04190 [Shouchella clausii]
MENEVPNTVYATLQHQSRKFFLLMGNWVEPRVERTRPFLGDECVFVFTKLQSKSDEKDRNYFYGFQRGKGKL